VTVAVMGRPVRDDAIPTRIIERPSNTLSPSLSVACSVR
jgi:hypothetical protein